jgi:hypothetical protein
MAKRLIALVVLNAGFVFGVFGLFNDSASSVPIQQFDTSGAYEVDITYCYDNVAPYTADTKDPAGSPTCAAGTSSTLVPKNEAVDSWSIVTIPVGARLAIPVTFTPSGAAAWQTVVPACGPLDANGECTAAALTGHVTARTDILCTNEPFDVLGGAGGAGGDPTSWPEGEPADAVWPEPGLVRAASGTPPTGGPNAYVPGIAPWPKTGSNAYGFVSLDTAVITQMYLSGFGPYAIPATRLQVLTGSSGYPSQAGLHVAVTLVGGSPDSPPEDSFNCFDSPQDAVAYFNFLKTPNADRVIPRWAIFESAPDIKDGTINRILDWSCVTVGIGEADTDGDCLPDGSEPLAASCAGGVNDSDCDNDLVPDGIEPFMGSSVSDNDTDNDGADDYDELFTFTDPTDTDSDDDGQADPQDLIPTHGSAGGSDAPTTGVDATTPLDDNCPADANSSQMNTDSMWQYHGHGAGTGDRSNPDEDLQGDACDADDDNDDLPDATEVVLELINWGGYSTDPRTVCGGPGEGGGPVGLLTADGDTDEDMVLDGRECQFRSNPMIALRGLEVDSTANGIASCKSTSPVDPDGCAIPNNGAGGGAADPDGDALFLPGAAISHHAVEATFRTHAINTGLNLQIDDIDADVSCTNGGIGSADKDADQDTLGVACGVVTLQDGVEVLYYGTSPTTADTDRDGCPDAEEVLDTSGDFRPTAGDSLAWAIERFGHLFAWVGRNDYDLDGDIDHYHGVNFDFNKNRILDSGDQLLQANALGTAAACAPSGEAAMPPLKAMK